MVQSIWCSFFGGCWPKLEPPWSHNHLRNTSFALCLSCSFSHNLKTGTNCPQNGGYKQYLIPKVEFLPGENLPFHLQNEVHSLSTLQRMHQPRLFWVKFFCFALCLLKTLLRKFILSYLSSFFYISCPALSLYCLFTWPPRSWLLGMVFPSLSVCFFPQIFVHERGKAGLTTVWLFLWTQLIFSQLMKYNNLIISESLFIFRVANPVPEFRLELVEHLQVWRYWFN